MVSVLRRWVLMLDLPYTLRQLQERGFNKIFLELAPDTKRAQIKAWKYKKVEVRGHVYQPSGRSGRIKLEQKK